MSTTLKIKITKEVLEKSKMCGVGFAGGEYHHAAISSCAISVACQEIFPNCIVLAHRIIDRDNKWIIRLPDDAQFFVSKFDGATPMERVGMPEFEFEVELNEEVISEIKINELKELLKNSTTLEIL
jgi:hypothetical protein